MKTTLLSIAFLVSLSTVACASDPPPEPKGSNSSHLEGPERSGSDDLERTGDPRDNDSNGEEYYGGEEENVPGTSDPPPVFRCTIRC